MSPTRYREPILVVNFKVYESSIGRGALLIGRAAERVYRLSLIHI